MASERYYHFIAQSIAIYILYRFVLSPSRNLWKVTHKTKRYVCIWCVCLWNYTFAGVISFGKLGPERSWYTCQRNLCVSFIDVKNKQRKSAIWGIPWIRPWNEDEWYIPWIKKRNVSNADGFGGNSNGKFGWFTAGVRFYVNEMQTPHITTYMLTSKLMWENREEEKQRDKKILFCKLYRRMYFQHGKIGFGMPAR